MRLLGWNVLLLAVGLALIAAAGEAWLRLTRPFMDQDRPMHFVAGVGYLPIPYSVSRYTNRLDFWTVQRANRFGFLDRDPPIPREHSAQSCYVTAIGDSFVMAMHVPIAAKLHVRLEELAARRLPGSGLTSSSFGLYRTGQIAQLPFYDLFARRLHPDLVVLVFVINDFADNSPILTAVRRGWDPDRPAIQAKVRPPGPDGAMRILPASPGAPVLVAARARKQKPLVLALWRRARDMGLPPSWFAGWLRAMWINSSDLRVFPEMRANTEALIRRPAYAPLFDDGWRPTSRHNLHRQFARAHLPRVFEDALAYTGFALDQFQERVERDGAALVVLASHTVGGRGNPAFERLRALTEARRIPLVSQHDWIVRQGGRVSDAHFRHDGHWNAQGHQWAAEALLEYLAGHPETCDRHRRTGEARRLLARPG